MFKLHYSGDFSLLLQTKVQVNPLHSAASFPFILAASKPLIVPMQLEISSLVLKGIVALTIDKEKGVTLVFVRDFYSSFFILFIEK